MSAIDTLQNIVNNTHLANYNFRYCLVAPDKVPYTIDDKRARPNNSRDFVDLFDIASCKSLENYEGLGISIIASNICAIDVDGCFKEPFNVDSGDERAKDIINMFKDKAYIEFSFSGKGLRLFFTCKNVENYSEEYYIKNSTVNIEYYQPASSERYVTITGKTIYDNPLNLMDNLDTVMIFLNKYMKRQIKLTRTSKNDTIDNRSNEELLKQVKNHYIKNYNFQDLWFEKAEGSGNGESEHDFHLLKYLYDNITKDKDKLKMLFEQSPFFKSKDSKHVHKWNYSNFRYFEYMWSNL